MKVKTKRLYVESLLHMISSSQDKIIGGFRHKTNLKFNKMRKNLHHEIDRFQVPINKSNRKTCNVGHIHNVF